VRRVNRVSNTRILDSSWPEDLDPETVPFATRAETVLRWKGFYNDPTLFNTLTVAEVAGWWNTGPVTIANIRMTGNAAICRHHQETEQRTQIAADLDTVSSEPWAKQIWHHDPRFKQFVPRGDSTVHDIATTRGTFTDRRYLWNRLDGLYTAIETQAVLGLGDAVAQYVEAISGQAGERLAVLLARMGLSGRDPISRVEAAGRLGVSYQRIHQLEQQLEKHRNRAGSPAGVWMPQVTEAQRTGWPDGYTDLGIAAILGFVSPQ
jgi:hypothetical protein